jgi:hypothetical protein
VTIQQEHRTKVRRRHGLCIASCSCGWSEQAVSNFGAWLASRRHVEVPRTRRPARRGEGPLPLDGAVAWRDLY